MYSDDIIVVLTPDKNIRKIEDNLLNAINVVSPSGDQALRVYYLIKMNISNQFRTPFIVQKCKHLN